MATLAFHVVIKPAPGQAAAVEEFLRWAKPRIDNEPGTRSWHALKAEDGSYAIFDTFDDEDARQTHLWGKVGDELRRHDADGVIFAESPQITRLTILASKQS